MNGFLKFFFILGLLSLTGTLFAQNMTNEDKNCLRCHAMHTLAYQDAQTGGLVNLYVDSTALKNSEHGGFSCLDCHSDDFTTIPHPATVKSNRLKCLDCHEDQEQFEIANEQFKESVHYERLGDKFSCASCHDAHSFHRSIDKNIPEIIQQDNGVCLSCHNAPHKFAELSSREYPDLKLAHSWLPNTELHWKSVRCVECHTSNTEGFSHQIMSKEHALHKCESCHSKNSILLTKLYRFRTVESRQQNDLLESVVNNDTYVVGMTRDERLDNIVLLLVLLTIGGISVHALGRYLANRRNN